EHDVFADRKRKRIPSRITLPGIVETTRRIGELNQAAPGRRVPDSTDTLKVGVVIKNPVRGADDGHAVTLWIPGQSRARCEMHPGRRMFGVADIGGCRIARKENTRRGVRKHGASKPLVDPLLVVLSGCGSMIVGPEIGFPAKAAAQRKLRGRFPGVLQIKTDVILAEILRRNLILSPFI